MELTLLIYWSALTGVAQVPAVGFSYGQHRHHQLRQHSQHFGLRSG